MKQFVCLVGALGLVVSLFAQMASLPLTTNKTTSLIFPFSVMHVDRGTREVLVQQVAEADNILLVKAGTAHLEETNLSVVTSDGSVYCFTVHYDAEPSVLVYRLPAQTGASIKTYANALLDNPRLLHRLHQQTGAIGASISGIYIKDSVFYFQLQFTNQSPIEYDIAYLRFSIRDKKQSTRQATQEIDLSPLYTAGHVTKVNANAQVTEVVALPIFTVPRSKYLTLDIGEQHGGRGLLLRVRNRHLLHARCLPDLYETR